MNRVFSVRKPYQYIRRFLGLYIVAVASGFLLAGVTGLLGIMVGPLLESLIGQGQPNRPQVFLKSFDFGFLDHILAHQGSIALSLISLALLRFFLHATQWYCAELFGEKSIRHLRHETYHLLMKQPKDFTLAEIDLSHSLGGDIRLYRDYLVRFYCGIPREIMQIIVLFSIVLWIDWQMTVSIFLILLPSVWVVRRYGKKLKERTHQALDLLSELTLWTKNRLDGMETILHYEGGEKELQDFGQYHQRFCRKLNKSLFTKAKLRPMFEGLTSCMIVFIIFLSLRKISLNQIAADAFFSYIASFVILTQSLSKLANYYGIKKQAHPALERVSTLLDYLAKNHKDNLQLDSTWIRSGPKISLQNLVLQFEQHQTAPITQTFEPGKSYWVEGKSGIGKSTLLKMLAQPEAFVPLSGTLTYPKHFHQKQIAYLDQKNRLVSGTIAQNLAYPHTNWDPQKIQEILETLCLQKLSLTSLTNAENTTLSGGERQRLALGKVFYNAPPVLLMDEALSAADEETEEKIMLKLLELIQKSQSVFIFVSHRQNARNYATGGVLHLQKTNSTT